MTAQPFLKTAGVEKMTRQRRRQLERERKRQLHMVGPGEAQQRMDDLKRTLAENPEAIVALAIDPKDKDGWRRALKTQCPEGEIIQEGPDRTRQVWFFRIRKKAQ